MLNSHGDLFTYYLLIWRGPYGQRLLKKECKRKGAETFNTGTLGIAIEILVSLRPVRLFNGAVVMQSAA